MAIKAERTVRVAVAATILRVRTEAPRWMGASKENVCLKLGTPSTGVNTAWPEKARHRLCAGDRRTPMKARVCTEGEAMTTQGIFRRKPIDDIDDDTQG